MERNQFSHFANDLKRLGVKGVESREFILGQEKSYALKYIPFEYVNRDARLVIVGITPGNTQLSLAYGKAQELLLANRPENEILVEIKKTGAFGGSSMKPNLLKILRHFHFNQLLGIEDVASLWDSNADLLHSTSVVPHAAFKGGKMFAGSFDEVIKSTLLKDCFLNCFVESIKEIKPKALFVGLGPCPLVALEWCVQEGVLQSQQVLGAFCHPSSSGGSTTRYYLREVAREDLVPNNPVLNRCDWLDQAYEQMWMGTASLLDGDGSVSTATQTPIDLIMAKPVVSAISPQKTKEHKLKTGKTAWSETRDIAIIISEIEKVGYKHTKETSKVVEFQSPGGQAIYLVKTTSKLNSINFMVHPGLKHQVLKMLDGVHSVSSEHRFHSNMTRFPKRINRGETKTAYGWQLNLATLASVPHFLTAFKSVNF